MQFLQRHDMCKYITLNVSKWQLSQAQVANTADCTVATDGYHIYQPNTEEIAKSTYHTDL